MTMKEEATIAMALSDRNHERNNNNGVKQSWPWKKKQ